MPKVVTLDTWIQENLDEFIKDNKSCGEGRGGMGSRMNYMRNKRRNNIPTYG
jgi:glutamate 5-kinase